MNKTRFRSRGQAKYGSHTWTEEENRRGVFYDGPDSILVSALVLESCKERYLFTVLLSATTIVPRSGFSPPPFGAKNLEHIRAFLYQTRSLKKFGDVVTLCCTEQRYSVIVNSGYLKYYINVNLSIVRRKRKCSDDFMNLLDRFCKYHFVNIFIYFIVFCGNFERTFFYFWHYQSKIAG